MKRIAALALAGCLATSAHAFEGAWTASRDKEDADRIYVQMTRGRTNNMGTTMPLRAFTGLSDAALGAAVPTAVRFELRREAGDTAFEGTFKGGKGAGQFTFVPRPEFLDGVRALGIDTGKSKHGRAQDQDEQLFGLAMCDVTLAYIKSMIAEGYRVGLDDYLSMRIFDVTPEYIHEMRDLGFEKVSHDELVASRIHGVTPSYVREMRKAGWDLSLDDYQASRIHGATPAFAEQMRRLGYGDLSHDDLLAFRIHGVTGEFIRELRDLGYADLSADDLIAARIHGITPEYIRQVEEAGYTRVPFDKLISLRQSGIDARTLEKMRVY